jgi:hypothetical protein
MAKCQLLTASCQTPLANRTANAPCGDFKAAAVATERSAESQVIDDFLSLHGQDQSI